MSSEILASIEDSILAAYQKRPWRLLSSGDLGVGMFRLDPNSDHLRRDITFRPFAPLELKDSELCSYLRKELECYSPVIGDAGEVKVRLGPNAHLEPVAAAVAFVYRRLLMELEIKEGSENAEAESRTK